MNKTACVWMSERLRERETEEETAHVTVSSSLMRSWSVIPGGMQSDLSFIGPDWAVSRNVCVCPSSIKNIFSEL